MCDEGKGIKQVSSNKKKQGDPRMGEGGDPRTKLKKTRKAFMLDVSNIHKF
jgi:hypothetical protein